PPPCPGKPPCLTCTPTRWSLPGTAVTRTEHPNVSSHVGPWAAVLTCSARRVGCIARLIALELQGQSLMLSSKTSTATLSPVRKAIDPSSDRKRSSFRPPLPLPFCIFGRAEHAEQRAAHGSEQGDGQ